MFWGWVLDKEFLGFGSSVDWFGAYVVEPSEFFRVGAFYINIKE